MKRHALLLAALFSGLTAFANPIAITSGTSRIGGAEGESYVVSGVITTGVITVEGTANLILGDDSTLVVEGGIVVGEGQVLEISAQGKGNGRLVTTGTSMRAGIGGSDYHGKCGTVTIDGGVIEATGASGCAGIGGALWGDGGLVTVNGGTVTAVGGDCAAGIGGGDVGSGGTIIVNGGFVSARAGEVYDISDSPAGIIYYAAGIGSGSTGTSGGSLTVNGGTVKAVCEYAGGDDIGNGSLRDSTIATTTITGGSVVAEKFTATPTDGNGNRLSCVTVDGLEGSVTVGGLEGYGKSDISACDGKACLWLPQGTYAFEVNGTPYAVKVSEGGATPVCPVTTTGVTVNGVDVGACFGAGWEYHPRSAGGDNYVELTGAGPYVLSGTNTSGAVMFSSSANATITLDNLSLACRTDDECCLWASNDVEVALYLKGTNTLDGSFAMGEGLCVENGCRLTIATAEGCTDENAVLIARGGSRKAGIAVSVKNSGTTSRLVIAGGTIDVYGGAGAAGIGGSFYNNWTYGGYNTEIAISGGRVRSRGGAWLSTGGVAGAGAGIGSAANNYWGGTSVAISGGFVEAYGGSNAAGIGGGCDSISGAVTVSGGTVFASRGDTWAADMICGDRRSSGDFRISGGSVILANGATRPQPVLIPSDGSSTQTLWCVTVPNLADGTPETSGLPATYGLDDVVVRDGKLCLWLPDGDYEFAVNGDSYVATVDGANAVATRGTAASAVGVFDAAGALIGYYPTVDRALASVTNGCTMRFFADFPDAFGLATDCDLVLDDNGRSVNAHLTVRRGCATLSRGFATDVIMLDSGSDTSAPACVRFAEPVPSGDVYISVLNADLRIGLPIVRGNSVAAGNVRVCQPGYAAFARDGNVVLDAVWSVPFVSVEVDTEAGRTNFTPFATFAEAIQAGDTVGLLDYVNDAMLFETNVVVGDVNVPAGRTVTLCSVLRRSEDGTNTAWTLGADASATLAGAAGVRGTLVLSDVRMDGALTLHPNATLELAESYALTNEHLYVTVAEPTTMKGAVLVTSEFWSAAELKRYCRVTNPGWTFAPAEGQGLALVEVGDFVAHLGGSFYGAVESAFAAASDGDTVELVSTTNTDTQASSGAVTLTSRVFTVRTPGTVRVGSVRRVTTGGEAEWEDPPAQPTVFDLDGVEVRLALGSELALDYVQVSGRMTLSGDGLLVVSNYTGQGRISVRIADAGEVAARRPIAVGPVNRLELVDSVGELVQSGDYVYWQYDIFAYSYEQKGNGIAYVTVNDGGKIKGLGLVESKVGTCRFDYVRENGEKREILLHLVYIDYANAIVRVPTDVETKYLSDDGSWKTARDGETVTADWKVDSNGDLTFLFDGQQRKVKGISSKPVPSGEVPGVIARQAQEDEKKGGSQIGGIIGSMLGTAAIGGILGGIAAGIGAGAGGAGAVLPGAIGAGGLAGLIGGEVAGDIPDIDVDPGADGDVEPEIPQEPDPQVQEQWRQRWEKFHNVASKFFDAVTIAQAVKDLVVMWTCPIEYKGLPHFATSFEKVHRSAQDDDDVRHAIHWFFTSSIHRADLLGKGCVDISADRSMVDFILTEAQAGSLEKGSDFERFQDAINWVMRIDAIFTSLVNEKVSWASIGGEVVTLFKNIVQQCRKNGYFDPPVNSSVTIPSGGNYTVSGMKFGVKEGKPAQPRTAPVIEVKSGATLRLSECDFAHYAYSTWKGLIHVESGAVLSLDATTFSDNVAEGNGTAPVVVDEGGVVWLYGQTVVDNLAAVKGDVRIGFGPYRDASPKSGNLTGSVYIGGDTRLGGRVGTVAFEQAKGWGNIHSLKMDRWYMPSVRGGSVYWDYRPGAQDTLRPRFADPGFSISMGTNSDGGCAHLSGLITNAWSGFYYTPVGANDLRSPFGPVAPSVLQSRDGTHEISVDVPVGDSPIGFFNVNLSDTQLK